MYTLEMEGNDLFDITFTTDLILPKKTQSGAHRGQPKKTSIQTHLLLRYVSRCTS